MNNLIGKFIGHNKIKDIKLSEKKTFNGLDVYEITYADDVKQEYPAKVLVDIATKKAGDPTELRDLRVLPVVEEILKILTEADLKAEDISYCFTKTQNSISESADKAFKKLWGKEKYEQTPMDIHRVLTKIDNDE